STRHHDHAHGRGAASRRDLAAPPRPAQEVGRADAGGEGRRRGGDGGAPPRARRNRVLVAVLVEGVQIGAPGVYLAPTPPSRELLGVRMDVCAFVGVAPRGPARVPLTDEELITSDQFGPAQIAALLDASPVEGGRPRRRSVAGPVESWDEYTGLFGRFEGPGRLPFAVAAFFEQGGRRAYVVRVVHEYLPDRRTQDCAVGWIAGFSVGGR